MSSDNIVYLNSTFVPENEATVPVTERGFFGGDGVYEVTRTFGPGDRGERTGLLRGVV